MKTRKFLSFLIGAAMFFVPILSFITGCSTHEHSFTAQIINDNYLAEDATCTSKAKYYYSCSCGEKGITTFEYGEVKDHNYGEPLFIEATHLNKGLITQICNDCGYTKKTEIAQKTDHTFDKQIIDDKYLKSSADCTHKATYYFSCECGECGSETFEYGEALGHTFDQQVIKDKYLSSQASCTAKAVYFYSCKCGEIGTKTFEYGELLPHEFTHAVTTEDYLAENATCTSKAKYYYSCSCGEKGSTTFESGNNLEHTYNKKIVNDEYLASAATCTNKATYYYSCECGAKGSETFEYGDLLPHVFDKKVQTQKYLKNNASCTEKEAYYYSCSCGEKGTEYFEVGEKLPHVFDQKVVASKYLATEATCTNKATYYYSCSCGECGTETFETGDKLSHTYNQEIINDQCLATEATCTSPARYFYSCICGDIGNEVFKSDIYKPHTLMVDNIVQLPTKTSDGIYDGTCAVCLEKHTGTFSTDLSGYTFLDYIETDGSQYINTDIVLNSSVFKMHVEASTSVDKNQTLISIGDVFRLGSSALYESTVGFWTPTTGDNLYYDENNIGGKIVYDAIGSVGKTSCYFNGYEQYCEETCVFNNSSLRIFSKIKNNSNKFTGKLYRLSLFVNGDTSYYLLPAIDSLGRVGLLDVLSGKFYRRANASSEEFNYVINDSHNHVFDKKTISEVYLKGAADCTHGNEYYYSCECGSIGYDTFFAGESTTHDYYYESVSYPTTDKDGSAYGTCKNCGLDKTITLSKIDSSLYTIVDYIESDGSQYIDTGLVIADEKQSASMVLNVQYESEDKYIYDGSVTILEYHVWNFMNFDKFELRMDYNPHASNSTRYYANGVSANVCLCDFETIRSLDEYNFKIMLFNLGNKTSDPWTTRSLRSKVYNSWISIDGSFERCFVPVINNTGEVGLYDAVYGVFYTNANKSGNNFKACLTDSISNYTQIEKLTFDGTNYLDTNTSLRGEWTQVVQFSNNDKFNQVNGYSKENNYIWGVDDTGYYSIFAYNPTKIKIGNKDTLVFTTNTAGSTLSINGSVLSRAYENEYTKELGTYCLGSVSCGGSPAFFDLYSLSFEGYNVKKNYVPVKRNSDDVLGLYETTYNEFFPLQKVELSDLDKVFLNKTNEFSIHTAAISIGINDVLGSDLAYGTNYFLKDENYTILSRVNFAIDSSLANAGTAEYALGYKSLYIDGQSYNFYVLDINGTGSLSNWISNMDIGDEPSDFHLGFESGADFILKRITPLFSTNTEYNRLLIVGHSRGSAVGGIVHAKLIENTNCFKKENVQSYLFACPRYSSRNVVYDNLFPINNKGDLVANVPLQKWGFNPEGKEIFLPTDSETMAKLDYYLRIRQAECPETYTDGLRGFVGTTDCSDVIGILNKMAPDPAIVRNATNRVYLGQLGDLLAESSSDLSAYGRIATAIGVNCFFNGISVDVDSAYAFGEYIVSHTNSIYSSHDPLTYLVWTQIWDGLLK